jgi:hypothetical protein
MADISYSIRVVDPDGDPVSGAEIMVSYFEFTGGTDTQHTDSEGWAEFETTYGICNVDGVYVNGLEAIEYPGLGLVEDGDTFSVTLPQD